MVMKLAPVERFPPHRFVDELESSNCQPAMRRFVLPYVTNRRNTRRQIGRPFVCEALSAENLTQHCWRRWFDLIVGARTR